jgi:hypothetical protein
MKMCKHRKALVQNNKYEFRIICFDCMKVIQLMHRVDYNESHSEYYHILETEMKYYA